MNLRLLLDRPGLHIEPSLMQAFIKTLEAWQSPYRGLPIPVRFRASGALRAWMAVFAGLPDLAPAQRALSDPGLSPNEAAQKLMSGLMPHVKVSQGHEAAAWPLISGMLHVSADMLCFWLRQGALFEPTLPLGSLLGGIDVTADLPMSFIQPQVHTLTILPPWQQRHLCHGMQAVTVYCHSANELQAPAKRCLTIRSGEVITDEGVTINELVMPVKDEDTPLSEAISKALQATLSRQEAAGLEGQDLDKVANTWRQVMDYTLKVLLYLQVDDAQVQPHRPYSSAPKEFPGLGRKKREAKLAEVDRLYDRYVIGPATLADWAGEHAAQLGAGGQLSPHWRRGHFRQQVHGPAQSLRKIMFIKPTLVRSDRLAEDQP